MTRPVRTHCTFLIQKFIITTGIDPLAEKYNEKIAKHRKTTQNINAYSDKIAEFFAQHAYSQTPRVIPGLFFHVAFFSRVNQSEKEWEKFLLLTHFSLPVPLALVWTIRKTQRLDSRLLVQSFNALLFFSSHRFKCFLTTHTTQLGNRGTHKY